MDKPLIAPENIPMWVASAFVLALVAFVFAFYAVRQNHVVVIGTQAEVLALNKKIEDLKASKAPAAVAAAPVAGEEKK